jgi:CBS domain-containing protein
MCKVRDILKEKGNTVHFVTPNHTVMDALLLMAEQDIGVVLIVENGEIEGIFSERDCVRDLAGSGECCLSMPIREIMVSPVYFVTPDQTLNDCMAVMTAKNIRHLPVLDEGRLAGLVSVKDVVETIISEKDDLIVDLEHLVWVNLV